MTNSNDSTCPKCGAPIPEDAPRGLCPTCVLAGAATVSATTASSAKGTPPPAIEEVAAEFPELEIVELIGAGGMGAVYKARQPKLDRFVALKILSHGLAEDPAFVERFNREARVLARLNHPNIVTVFDFGTAGPFCYLLMENVDGVNLRQAMHAGGFTSGETLALIRDICAALSFAHEEGILHRDIKPENVLIDSRGRVKIADFGIAKLVGEDPQEQVTLTLQGSVLGSPHYMAPEQIETPGDVDQRADIYSLGVVFYELLTGELPLGRFAPPSEKASMDARIDEIVMRTLEKEREARFQSAGEIQTHVEAVTQSQSAAPPAPSVSELAPQPSASPMPETARGATASALLTGGSLLMAGVATIGIMAAQFMAMDAERKGGGIPVFILPMIALVGLLVAGIPAFLGFFFGTKALGEIRHSGGQKGGFGSAMFGTLTWPVILVAGLTGALVNITMYATEGGGLRPDLFTFIAAIVGPLILLVLIRSVWRWALGIHHGDRSSSGLRAATTVLSVGMVALLAILGLLHVNPGGMDDDHPELRGPKGLTSSSVGGSSGPKAASSESKPRGYEVTWHEMDGPATSYSFTVPAGRAATFKLVRKDESGKQVGASKLNWCVVASDTEPYEGLIGLGVTDRRIDNDGIIMDVRATIENLNEGLPRSLQYGTAFGIGNVSFFGGGMNTLSEDERKTLQVGYFIPGNDPLTEPKQTLELVVESAPRPGPGKPFVLPQGLLDSGEPSELVDEWISKNAPEPEGKADGSESTVKWAKGKPEIEIDFVAPAGRLTIFALRKPWDPKHECPDDWYVVATDDKDFKGTIQIGTTGSPLIGPKESTHVAARLQDSEGKWTKVHMVQISGDQEVSLPPAYQVFDMDSPAADEEIKGAKEVKASGTLDLTGPGVHFLGVCVRRRSELDDSLRLLAWSVPRPGSRAPAEARIGPVPGDDMIDNWVRQRLKQLRTKEPAEPFDEFAVTVDEAKGTVLARSGLMFDTRERRITGKAQIAPGEMFLLTKGSEATVYLNSETPVRLGPQMEDAILLFHHSSQWFLTPSSGLQLQMNDAGHGSVFDIITPAGRLTMRGPAAFQISSGGKLLVSSGEVEVVQNSDGKTTVLKTGQELALATPPMPWETDPSVEAFIESTTKLHALLEGVADEGTARKVAPEALKLARKWEAQFQPFKDAMMEDADPPRIGLGQKTQMQERMEALSSIYEELRQDPELAGPLRKVIEVMDRILGPSDGSEPSIQLERD